MADEKNILFSGEFDGQGISKGVDEILSSLEKVQEAEVLVKTAIKETTTAMKENRKEAEKLAKQKPLDPKNVEALTKKIEKLNEEYEELVHQNAELVVVQKKVNAVGKEYAKVQREQQQNAEKVSKAVGKFTSVNELAADGIKKVGNFAKDAAFGIISGFAGGILASAIPAIVGWISQLGLLSGELSEFQKEAALVNDINSKAAEGYSQSVTRLEILRAEINNQNNTQKQRIALIEEYNKIADEGNKIDLTQLNNTNLVNAAIDRQIGLIKQRAIARAAENIIAEKAEKLLKLQFDREQKFPQQSDAEINALNKSLDDRVKAINEINKKAGVGSLSRTEVLNFVDLPEDILKNIASKDKRFAALLDEGTRFQTNSLKNRLKMIQDYREGQLGGSAGIASITEDINEAQADFDRAVRIGLGLITPEGLTSFDGGKAAKEVENVFEQRLAELRARLAAASASTFQSEPLIRDKFKKQLDKEFLEIGRLLKDGKLTIPQADILKGVLKQINDIELTKGLNEFAKKKAEALNRVNDIILQLQLDNETKRINNLRDEFQREQEQVEINYQQSVKQINKISEDFRTKIDEDTKAGLISPEIARRKKYIASALFGGLLDEAEQARTNANIDLAFKQFNRTLETARQGFEDQLLVDNERTTKLIGEQTQLFLTGKLTYDQYQKALTKILREESAERRRIQLAEAQDQLRLVDEQLKKTTDEAQRKQLEQQRNQLRLQISQLQREVAGGDSEDKNKAEDERIKQLLDYVNAVNQLATAVLGFWQQVNQAEAAALDRSIALQNKRVENAKELAEKGNAEYLELEQKRLDELERKREKNARKQIAINNALTASQAIVAAITAIAQATQSGSALAAVAAVAAVIGAIGAAYSFVNSLQPQEANFFEGTPYVQGKEGRDKIPAKLTKGERVTTVKDNKDYWDTLEAIRTRRISPEVMNSFVESYPNNPVPVVDFDRLSSATDGKLGHDSLELLNRVDRLNGTMEQVVVGLSEIGVNVKMDSEGFEASISKARRQRVLRSRS